MEKVTRSLEETKALAREWLASLGVREAGVGATIVGLAGDLGAGKTSFVQGVARALGVTVHVTSPTFILERRYEINHPRFTSLIHIDAYRLEGRDELKHLNWDAISRDPANLILVEWPERIFAPLPNDMIKLRFEYVNDQERKITI